MLGIVTDQSSVRLSVNDGHLTDLLQYSVQEGQISEESYVRLHHELEQAREQAESTNHARGSSSMPQNVSEQPAVEPRDASKSKEKQLPKKKSTTEADGSSRSERSQEKAQRRSERAKKKKQKQERAEASAS